MFYNSYPAYQAPRIQASYTNTVSELCEKAYMSMDAFRILLRSVGSGFQRGRFVNEDGMQIYGWRIREKDGSCSAIITDVVESSPKSRRTNATFDVDYDYAIHRDRFLRDANNHRDYNMLGYIHSHPGHMTYFSQTDIETMSEYTRTQMPVMLSGLVTLSKGDLELTMYAVTQEGNHMRVWNLPLIISDEEVNRRRPKSNGGKPLDQIWCEVTGSSSAPRFRMLENAEIVHVNIPAKAAEETCNTPAEAPSRVNLPASIDLSSISEGMEGSLCGRMESGKLRLFITPSPVTPHSDGETSLTADETPDSSGIPCSADSKVSPSDHAEEG